MTMIQGIRFKRFYLAVSTLFLALPSCNSDNGSMPIGTDAENVPSTEDGGISSNSSTTERPDGSNTDAGKVEQMVLIDDFEDGNSRSLIGGYWFVYDDSSNQGASEVEIARDPEDNLVSDGDGFKSQHSFYLNYRLDKGGNNYKPYVGCGVTMNVEDEPYDASQYKSVSYFYKGNDHVLILDTFDVEDYDYYLIKIPGASDWQEARISFSDFYQAGWGQYVPLNLNNIRNLAWEIRGESGDNGSISIDNVSLSSREMNDAADIPDLQIKDLTPPEDNQLDSIEIDNPAQELALSKLNKGYNITNWLEQERFETFKYDEQYIVDLAANGFRALRFPIDLDRYILDRDEYFTGNAEFKVDPDLFTILDAFEQWTRTADMSLTIDYHQYDGTFDMTDPLYVSAVIDLWTSVAEHYSDNKRTDLFFEIMNEPELSGDTDSVDQDEWRSFAEQIIDGIRSVNSTHYVLFGDVSWNAIKTLTKQTPLNKDKVIYIFHFYEPFIFTHQGADFADMSKTHDIPYPYSTDRWSEYSSDFGFDANIQPEWQFSLLRLYYVNGSKSALRNQLIAAKNWGVENNVPVICNEFGVYDRTCRKEDRIRYYTDLIDIFEELEIPWQHWFMLVDAESGQMDDELKAALGLK